MLRAILVLGLMVAPAAHAQGSLPAGCGAVDLTTYACRWSFETQPSALDLVADVPVFPGFTVATIVVELLQSPDLGWSVTIEARDGEGWTVVSESQHEARETMALRHYDESTHVLRAWGDEPFRLILDAGYLQPPLVSSTTSGVATGRFEVAYVATRVAEGVVPTRPAATADDPHVADTPQEVDEPAWDIRAVWWDDARLDDGLVDVHMRVASLTDIPPSAFQAPVAPTDDPGTLSWKASWRYADEGLYVQWLLPADSLDDGAVTADEFRCELRTEAATSTDIETVRAIPHCEIDLENATLHAVLPEAAIGAPSRGVPFTELAGRTRVALRTGEPDVVEQATSIRYLFALGGPSVWSGLNDRLDPPPATLAEWADDPLGPEHAADTLQVVGTAAALGTFLAGLVLLWRRRRRTAELLAKVDAVEDGGIDARSTLLALGELEEEFTRLFRRHRISEAQYQALSQRIASVATRHTLRKELGLDDGVPGDAGPSNVRVRRVDRP